MVHLVVALLVLQEESLYAIKTLNLKFAISPLHGPRECWLDLSS